MPRERFAAIASALRFPNLYNAFALSADSFRPQDRQR